MKIEPYKSFGDLLDVIKKEDTRLYDALIRGDLSIRDAYLYLQNHEERIKILELVFKRCFVYASKDQTITSGTLTALEFDLTDYDNDDMHDDAVNNTRITFNTPGWYNVGCCIEWENNTLGRRELFIRYNGATLIWAVTVPATGTHGEIRQMISRSLRVLQGDYIEFMVRFAGAGVADLDILEVSHYSPQAFATMEQRWWNPDAIPDRQMG